MFLFRDSHVTDKMVSRPRLFFNMEIPIPGKDGLSTETGPMCYGDMSWNNINWRINREKVNFGRVSCHEPMLGVSQCQIRTSALQLQYARKIVNKFWIVIVNVR